MTTFRQTLGKLACHAPPIAGLISERDRLRDENRQLGSQLGNSDSTAPHARYRGEGTCRGLSFERGGTNVHRGVAGKGME
jgi:hypothetical protein